MPQPIRIAPFLGMSPRVAERLLPDGAAVDATNLVLTSGEIRPIKRPALVETPTGSGPWLAVYRAEYGGDEEWLAWTVDVDVARVPLSSDVEARYCWTGAAEPRMAVFSGLPSTFYSLGVPAPKAAPSVGHSGGTGSAVSRVYGYTFFSALGEESAMSPASTLNVAHGLGAVPKLFKVTLKCTDAGGEAGYSQNDEVAADFVFVSGVSIIRASADATNVNISYDGASTQVPNKSTRAATTITSAKWAFVVRAWA